MLQFHLYLQCIALFIHYEVAGRIIPFSDNPNLHAWCRSWKKLITALSWSYFFHNLALRRIISCQVGRFVQMLLLQHYIFVCWATVLITRFFVRSCHVCPVYRDLWILVRSNRQYIPSRTSLIIQPQWSLLSIKLPALLAVTCSKFIFSLLVFRAHGHLLCNSQTIAARPSLIISTFNLRLNFSLSLSLCFFFDMSAWVFLSVCTSVACWWHYQKQGSGVLLVIILSERWLTRTKLRFLPPQLLQRYVLCLAICDDYANE